MNCCAVLVTFNRKKLLLECISGLLNQTKQLTHIVILDNNSNDDTESTIKEKFGSHKSITFIQLGENTGGAGGFYHGIKWAYEQGYEWFWLMDDDVEPEFDCLEKMSKFTQQSKCLHPTKRYTDNGEVFNWEGHLNPKNSYSVRLKNEKFRTKEYTTTNIGCFEGMLIHKDIVKKIGFPDPRFFITGDDLIYGHLASKHTPVYYLRDPEFKKKILKNEKSYFLNFERPYQSPFYLYFNTRNHFLKKDYLIKDSNGSPCEINKILMVKNLKLLIESILFFRSYQHIKMFTLGLFDGLRRNFQGHKRFIK
jgi:GT2 family glycosyltransferase